ncbi:hypothetical protein VE00_09324 [Pseudogymnoascus sp. WSF 3629]|nr:hypothetical protein VE00_09324 [Pseudogymnoascus sp. WSF 3629]
MEYPIRDIPIEENFSAIGQWAPWATGEFRTRGIFVYQHGDPPYDKQTKEDLQAVINEATADPPDDDKASFVTAEDCDNAPKDTLREPGWGEESSVSKASNTLISAASQRYVPKAHITPDGHEPSRRVRSASMENDTASLPEEADISTYKTTVVEDICRP